MKNVISIYLSSQVSMTTATYHPYEAIHLVLRLYHQVITLETRNCSNIALDIMAGNVLGSRVNSIWILRDGECCIFLNNMASLIYNSYNQPMELAKSNLEWIGWLVN